MFILGISAFYHDSAACLIKDGEIIAATQEERFTRIKNDSSFPINSILYCINEAKIDYKDLNHVVFYEKPFLKFERIIETHLSFAGKGFKNFKASMPLWIKNKLFQKKIIIDELNKNLGNKINWKNIILFSDHHLSHASSAFFPSPFEKAAILILDGVGEWSTSSIYIGNGNDLELIKQINFPNSLGLLYSAFTYYIGFKVNSGEYKLMGLAPYGKPKYSDIIKKELITISDDGSFKINLNYFDFPTGLKMISKKFEKLFSLSTRKPESEITQKHMDLAASIQAVTEEIIIKIAKNIIEETGQEYLCLAGGVALNCVANGKLNDKNLFKDIWVQPAAGDAGGSLGAALAIWYLKYKNKRSVNKKPDSMKGTYLGPRYDNDHIESILLKLGANYKKVEDKKLNSILVENIIDQKSVGFMQGRMEFGPRALGSRSIIADPRSSDMQKKLNLKIKFRESFRPFAPSVLKEEADKWFFSKKDNPYMLFVSKIKDEKKIKILNDNSIGFEKLNFDRSLVPAVTHVDYTSRVQIVDKKINEKFYNLLFEFFKKTGCPILVNTSFNVRGEPIVCTPEDAYNCFMNTNLDILVVENFILFKNDQNNKKIDHKRNFELD